MIKEVHKVAMSGFVALIVLVVLTVTDATAFTQVAEGGAAWMVAYAVASMALLVAWAGLFIVNPNEAKVLQLFGRYVGTVRDPGLKYVNTGAEG